MTVVTIPQNSCYELIATGDCTVRDTCPHKHRSKARLCTLCDELYPNQQEYNTHIQSTQHREAAQHESDLQVPLNCRWCLLCRCFFTETNLNIHYNGPQHISKSRAASLKLYHLGAKIDTDDFEIEIQGDGHFGVAQPSSEVMHLFTITVTDGTFELMKTEFLSGQLVTPFTLWIPNPGLPLALSKTRPLELRVSFQHKDLGRYENHLQLTFLRHSTGKSFCINRKLTAVVGETEAHQKLAPIAPYVAHPPIFRQAERSVTAGAEPPSLTIIPYKFRLPPARIPSGLASAIAQGAMSQVLASVRRSYLPRKFGDKSYSAHFKILLWIEEAKAEEDMLLYDMEGVSLEPHKGRHWLEVPGLAENRPSVMLGRVQFNFDGAFSSVASAGDRLLIRRQNDQEGHWFEGRVWDVQQLKVDLRLPGKAAKTTAQNRCDVRFKLNRIPLQRQHQALDVTGIPERITFPKSTHVFTLLAPQVPKMFANPQVGTNIRQREAVSRILSHPPGSAPFIIFGPPGTGKTVTVVEAIKQLLKSGPNIRILACAPSNPAADIIARRLMHLGNAALFRFYAPSRLKKHVDEDMLPFTFIHGQNGPFSVPPLDQLMKFRVVITTCVSGSVPFGVGVPSGHFTHIFIDEAGQATEPEVMVSIRTMLGQWTNLILSGDPEQLGPIIRSGVARELGLGKSYLERLMESPLYNDTGEPKRNIVKLTKNFRSHNAILKFPNEEFYNGELEACGDPKTIDQFVNSPFLPTKEKRFPIVFYAIPGKDERESTSPSFFNIHEITAVKDYVMKLKAHGIADNDIGIVAPYRAQCQKIRIALKGLGEQIKIGSVEEFQGDERLVIIISTVRSNENFLEHDARFTLGFVSSPRRFNVAVTRAKALLLVVGDSRVLSLDPLWRSFMNYVHTNGGWRGMEPDWDTRASVDQTGKAYARQRREAVENSMAALTARLYSLHVEDDTAAVDRPPFVELE